MLFRRFEWHKDTNIFLILNAIAKLLTYSFAVQTLITTFAEHMLQVL